MSAFPCPVAGCASTDTEVLDTRERPQRIWRRRKCTHGHRFTTLEAARIVPDDHSADLPPLAVYR